MGEKRISCYICLKTILAGEESGWRPYFGDFHKECFAKNNPHPKPLVNLAFFRFDKNPDAYILEIFLWMQVLAVFAFFLMFASIAAKAANFDLLLLVDLVTLIILSGTVPLAYARHSNSQQAKKNYMCGKVIMGYRADGPEPPTSAGTVIMGKKTKSFTESDSEEKS